MSRKAAELDVLGDPGSNRLLFEGTLMWEGTMHVSSARHRRDLGSRPCKGSCARRPGAQFLTTRRPRDLVVSHWLVEGKPDDFRVISSSLGL